MSHTILSFNKVTSERLYSVQFPSEPDLSIMMSDSPELTDTPPKDLKIVPFKTPASTEKDLNDQLSDEGCRHLRRENIQLGEQLGEG